MRRRGVAGKVDADDTAIEHRAELEATIGDAVSRAHADARSVAALLRERYTPPGFVTTAT